MTIMDCDVAIIGCGPVGATLANLLGKHGVSVTVLEREPGIYHAPRAGHFDGEIMRVFQAIGLADRISERVRVSIGMRFVNAKGELLLDWPRPQEVGPMGWHASYRFHQPDLETILRDGMAKLSPIDLKLRCDAFAVDDFDDHVEIRYEDLNRGTIGRIRASYVVGCDGARSTVRRFMGTPLDDLLSHENWLIVDGILNRPRPDLPDHTIQYCDPARPLTVIRMIDNRRRWEFMLMPGDDPAFMTRPEKVWKLLERWIGPDEMEIERAVVYTFHSVVASGWLVGRKLLAGDACHQTPPFMGQGMCAGIRDAANLSWKLAAVIRGRAGLSLLDTYETERSPHVREFISTAVRLGGLIQTRDPEQAAKRDRKLLQNPSIMQTPVPPLGPGLHTGTGAAGRLVPQFRQADGRRMDDIIGLNFAALGTRSSRPTIGRELNDRLEQLGAVRMWDDTAEIKAYLAELNTETLVIRPDRYILGSAEDTRAFDALAATMPLAA
ncbi:MAG: bifunctional 3-(3-hydroxy-phenyl)propionate/3-hydroxycinnamic acid hydroxylase [Hyphomicrobiaceae bacterium]